MPDSPKIPKIPNSITTLEIPSPKELTPVQQEALNIIQNIALDDEFSFYLSYGVGFAFGFDKNNDKKHAITWEQFATSTKVLKPQLIEAILDNFKHHEERFASYRHSTSLNSMNREVLEFIEKLQKEMELKIDYKTDILDRLPSIGIPIASIVPTEVIGGQYGYVDHALILVKEYEKLGLDITQFDIKIPEGGKKEIIDAFLGDVKTDEESKWFQILEKYKLFDYLKLRMSDSSVELIKAKYYNNGAKLAILLNKQDIKKCLQEIKSICGDQFLESIIQFISQSKFIPPEIQSLIFLLQKIKEADSPEIQRLLSSLTGTILESENPQAIYEKIINIFAQNHLPTVAKYFLLFNELYPSQVLQSRIIEHASPVLREAGDKRRRFIMWTDLVKSQIKSGNFELLNYLQQIQNSEKLLEKLEQNETLNTEEIEIINNLFTKFGVVYSQTTLAKRRENPANLASETSRNQTLNNKSDQSKNSQQDLQAKWQELKNSFGMQSGQKLTDRLIEMFAKPLGLNSLQEILNLAKRLKQEAGQRNRQNLENVIEQNSLVKAVNSQDLELILGGGLVAREFIGGSTKSGNTAGSDMTPFDLDTVKVGNQSRIATCEDLEKIGSYGDVILTIKDRGQFEQHQNLEKVPQYNSEKYELIHTPVVAPNHYGVRTALASTEISQIVLTESFQKSEKKEQKTQELFYKIARNGFYIPVFDKDGKLIFTPDDFDKFRQIFAGIDRFGGDKIEIKEVKSPKLKEKMKQVLVEQAKSHEILAKLQQALETTLKAIFEQFRILEQTDSNYLGFELQDSGSTGRKTHLPPIGDFDYICRLSNSDFKKVQEVIAKITAEFGLEPFQIKTHSSGKDGLQLRIGGILPEILDPSLKGNEPLELDLGFYPKSKMDIYLSHTAVEEKLASIVKNYGPGKQKEVVANILLLKKILKENKIYKRQDGGPTGIGVENLVLRFGGNLESVFEAILKNSKDLNNNTVSIVEFRQKILLLNAGTNARDLDHDDYLVNLTEESFGKLVEIALKFSSSL